MANYGESLPSDAQGRATSRNVLDRVIAVCHHSDLSVKAGSSRRRVGAGLFPVAPRCPLAIVTSTFQTPCNSKYEIHYFRKKKPRRNYSNHYNSHHCGKLDAGPNTFSSPDSAPSAHSGRRHKVPASRRNRDFRRTFDCCYRPTGLPGGRC